MVKMIICRTNSKVENILGRIERIDRRLSGDYNKIVNKFLVKLLLVGFIGIAVFGFLAMGHSADFKGKCLASVVNRSICPVNMADAVNFYLSAFKSFSLAVLSFGLNLMALAAVFAAVLCFVIFSPLFNFNSFSFSKSVFAAPANIKRNFLRWLSLHEQSPNFD